MENKDGTIPEKIIEGSMIVIGLAEVAHLLALFFHMPFHTCVNFMVALLGAAFVFLIVWISLHQIRHKGKRSEHRLLKLLSVYPFLIFLVGFLIMMQIIWYVWGHLPYLNGDITVETVRTILATDQIYTVNPMTGQTFTQGMPTRLKILVLPTLYATICKITGIDLLLLCYSIIPSIVLIISYVVYSRWAIYLFPKEGKKQAIFMLFTVLVYQFGCYGMAMDSFLLFFQGYQGAAFRAGVILPYALLSCLKGKWMSVILCILAEACVVWTLYGLGYTVIVVLVFLAIKTFQNLFYRRKRA
ncbi:MAG TPA: DUF6077 domain-containing protein [Lachnospiraceae bacterium]|nr:DUF6077 domain-containing protein [Lachnospiraceae bacterium]